MVGYLIALLAVALAAGIRLGLEPWLAGRAHYLVFIVAVFIAALFGGTGPAIVAAPGFARRARRVWPRSMNC